MGWADDEWRTADLGDKRLNRRLVKVGQALADKPTESIPNACGRWADTQAAYRMLGSDRFDWRAVLEPHVERTKQRMQGHSMVLCLQDTTELDFNGQTIEGLGPLSYEAQRGMYVHPTYAVSAEREPLGVLDAWMWAREARDAKGVRAGVLESTRWVEGYERLAEMAHECPETRLMQVGDRESDMFELMERAQQLGWPVDLLVRSQHNRTLAKGEHLWDEVQASEVIGRIEFKVPARPGRRARKVTQELRARRMKLARAGHSPVEMTCVIATEVDTPANEKPVVWRLLTNREVGDLAQAVQVIDWYRARWEIEIFFHVLKTGCRVEALQLASVPKIERALAMYLVISWRIASLMRMGRTCPDLPADLVFDSDEIRAAYILNKKRPPKETPRLNEVVRLIAQRGGFLGRKHDGEPGVKTIWLGLREVAQFVEGLHFMQSIEEGD